MKTVKNNKQELLDRVNMAKKYMKHNKIKQADAIDAMYGPMFHTEHIKVTNLFRGYATSESFTDKLEDFLRTKKSITENEVIKRFNSFIAWYNKMGGRKLSDDEKNTLINKFK